MNYIVLDLEWNQSPIGQAGEHPRMPFEIIEIGAAKINENYEFVEEFRRLITPKLYPKLHKYIKELLSYDEKELRRKGVSFKKACTEFLEWCGEGQDGEKEDYIFCTWGPSDLTYLQTNMDFYRMDPLPFPLKFYDIQQIYAEKYTKDNSICKLEKAVDFLNLEMERTFHEAVNDAYYTAMVLKEGKFGNISDKYSIDLYKHPKTREDVIIEYHDRKLDYISEEFDSKKEAMKDQGIMSVKCPRCGRKVTIRIPWFPVNSGTEYSVGKCFLHGNMLASVKFKSASDSTSKVFVVKRIVPISKKRYIEVSKKRDLVNAKKEDRMQKYKAKLETREGRA